MSSNSMDYIVYSGKFGCNATFVVVSDSYGGCSMIPFVQKTWFVWCIVATLIICRLFS
jgi:hypothetical protein